MSRDRSSHDPSATQPIGVAVMPRQPQIPGSRSSAETRYRDLRRLAFQNAQGDLAAAGVVVELRAIDATAIVAFGAWQGRRVAWPWRQMVADWRHGHPDRFELAVWSGGTLCGLAMGRPAPTASHLSLYYLEGNPDSSNPLHFQRF